MLILSNSHQSQNAKVGESGKISKTLCKKVKHLLKLKAKQCVEYKNCENGKNLKVCNVKKVTNVETCPKPSSQARSKWFV